MFQRSYRLKEEPTSILRDIDFTDTAKLKLSPTELYERRQKDDIRTKIFGPKGSNPVYCKVSFWLLHQSPVSSESRFETCTGVYWILAVDTGLVIVTNFRSIMKTQGKLKALSFISFQVSSPVKRIGLLLICSIRWVHVRTPHRDLQGPPTRSSLFRSRNARDAEETHGGYFVNKRHLIECMHCTVTGEIQTIRRTTGD